MWPKEAFGGSATYGFPVGILTISTRHALLPGNVQNAQSFPLPVVYEEVAVEDPHVLMHGDPALLPAIISAAQRLAKQGVRAVAGACGSFAYYQKAVADAVDVPVFLSILTQVPFIQQSLGTRKKLCIICAAEFTMNERVFAQCNITDTSNLVIRQMCGHPEFDRMVKATDPMDPAKMRDEVVAVSTGALRDDRTIAAFLLQCSDLPPFASAVQQATGLPVFDMTLLIRWLQSAACYLPYSGMTRAQAARL
jgi:aspartate/glutamate racemase